MPRTTEELLKDAINAIETVEALSAYNQIPCDASHEIKVLITELSAKLSEREEELPLIIEDVESHTKCSSNQGEEWVRGWLDACDMFKRKLPTPPKKES